MAERETLCADPRCAGASSHKQGDPGCVWAGVPSLIERIEEMLWDMICSGGGDDETVRARATTIAALTAQSERGDVDRGFRAGIEAAAVAVEGLDNPISFGPPDGFDIISATKCRIAASIRALSPTPPIGGEAGEVEPFQARVQPWLMACFGAMIAGDREERNHRFLEEALELVQSTGCTASEAHQLVDYVYGRTVGEPTQEVGGVMVTLAALCLANGLDMHEAAETELARIWTKVEAIRAKQAAKPKHSPLPEASLPRPPEEKGEERLREALKPFADFAEWVATNHPGWDHNEFELQQHDFPYALSMAWFREARAALHPERPAPNSPDRINFHRPGHCGSCGLRLTKQPYHTCEQKGAHSWRADELTADRRKTI